MSKLASRRSRNGPVTSTQVEGDNNGENEYMSREERVFQRQLEAAIEMSKKAALEKGGASSESELSQETAPKRKSDDNLDEIVSKKKPKRDIIESDDDDDDFGVEHIEDSDDEFSIGATKKKEKKKTEKKSAKMETKKLEKKQKKDPKMREPQKKDESIVLEEDKDNISDKSEEEILPKTKKRATRKLLDDDDDEFENHLSMKNVEDCKLTVAPTSRSDTDNDKIASLKENLSVNCETPKLSKKEIKVNSSKKEAISKKEPVKKEVSTPQNSPKMESPVSLGVSRPKLMTQMPKWTPPARASKNSSSGGMRSNNLSPGFRVGLSRNVKVTPLHPNVKLK